MNQSAQDTYLQTQVLTATPQKLRLMLIEGAIRFARRTIHAWENGQDESATDSLIRCRDIIAELLAAVRPDETQLTRDVGGIYWFLFQTLTSARAERNPEQIKNALRVLEVERETWQQVCSSMPDAPRAQCSTNEIPSHGVQNTAASTPISPSSTSSVSFDA